MASENAYVFSQQDLMTSSFSIFYDMKKSRELSDVTIRTNDRVFAAHRIILAAAIPYFRAIFASKTVEEVIVEELDPQALESLIDFAYTSKVKITIENVQSLLVASSFFQLIQVRDTCCDFISKRLDIRNVVNFREVADTLNCLSLVKNTDNYVKRNFKTLCQTKEFLSLPFSFLNDLIRKDDLEVSSEEEVFDAVMRWVNTDPVRQNMLPDLLTGVRMTFLNTLFLIKRASKEKLIVDSVPCKRLLDEATRYHLLPEERSSSYSFTVSERRYGRHEGCGIYLFCCSETNGLTVFKYTEGAEKWNTVLKDKSRSDVQHVLVLGDEIYIFRSNTFETLNSRTLAWTTKAAFPTRYSSFSHAVCCNGKIFWFENSETACEGVWFDTQRNQWLRYAHQELRVFSDDVLMPSGNMIYIFRSHYGFRARGRRNEMYDLETQTVYGMLEMKNERSMFGSAVLDDTLYVCGGISGSPKRKQSHETSLLGFVSDRTEIYRPSQGWQTVSAMNTPRANFSLVAYNKKLYAIGGTSEAGDGTECYDSATDKWTFAGSFVNSHYDFVKAVVVSGEKK